MTRRGVSLVELLVGVAVVGALTGLTLTAVQKVRASAARTACQNNLRQQGLAVLGYESAKGRLPPGSVSGPFEPLGVPDGVAHGLWPVVLPQLGEEARAKGYRLAGAWDAATNRPATAGRLPVLECPAAEGERPADGVGVAHAGPLDVNPFLADLGLIDPASKFEGPLPVNGRVRLTEITDGAANTILVAGACGRGGVAWPAPECTIPVKDLLAGGPHRGANVCLADGSVRLIPAGTDVRVVARLATRAGGESVGQW